MRARLLLDDADRGRRRACAASWRCRPVRGAGRPGRGRPGAGGRARRRHAPGSLGPSDPALLEQLPGACRRARLIVDGYNVSKTAWPTSSLEAQRDPAARRPGPARRPHGRGDHGGLRRRRLDHPPAGGPPRGVKVLFSPAGVIADDVIRDLVAAEPAGRRSWW